MTKMDRIQISQWLAFARANFEDIKSLNPPHEKIVNFGCNIGGETFDLMLGLDPEEIVGIDINERYINQAKEITDQKQRAIRESARAYNLARTGDDDRRWWMTEIPSCVRKGVLPTFIIGDMTKLTSLDEAYYDLAYCSSVLYHIDENHWISAVEEMKRVVKPSGWIIACEASIIRDEKYDFTNTFEDVGLTRVDEAYEKIDDASGLYIYRR